MKYERDDLTLVAYITERLPSGNEILVARCVAELRRCARRLHRLCEIQCERELNPAEIRREHRLENACRTAAAELGCRVSFNGDPRGFPVRLKWADPGERQPSNNWGGEDWGM